MKNLDNFQFQFWSMGLEDAENKTGCKRNCEYRNYFKFQEQRASIDTDEIWFEMKLSRSVMNVKTETLMFPIRSLVADIGGTLGLFLGFSFVMIWEFVETFIIYVKHHFTKK